MTTLSLWTRRDPFAEFDALFRTAFLPAQVRAGAGRVRQAGFVPAAEILRDGDDALVRLELPGLDVAKDVTVEMDRGQLVVRGERRDERSDERDGRSVREVRYGSFRRTFTLPQHVTDDAVSATYDAGVLTVKVAGAYAGQEPRRIAVTSATPDTETGAEDTGAQPAA
jgi:HSP20 family molecular chaperone IbpA